MNAEGYSEAVYKAIENGVKPADALERLSVILARHGHAALYPRILKNLEIRFKEDADSKTARVRVAKKEDAQRYKKEIESFRKDHSLDDATVVVDDSIIGGYVILGKDVRTDASYKTSLLKIYQNLTN